MGTGKQRARAAGGVHVALLRGINVGGNNKLPMVTLAAIFEAAGCTEVRTYIQSGNVVYRPPGPAVADAVEAAISRTLGLQIPVVTRTSAELAAAVAANPFLAGGADPGHCYLGFLARAPEPARVQALDPERSPGDRFLLRGRDLYLHLPHGSARSKLTNAYFDRALATVTTVRNWRTVLALAALAGG